MSDDEEAAEEGTAAEIPEQDFEATEAEADVDEGTTTASSAEGYVMEINNPNLGDMNGPVKVCAFTMTYIADMPQQQSNSGCASVMATFGCRSCFVEDKRPW